MKWLTSGGPDKKGHGTDQVDPIVVSTLTHMRSTLGFTKVGAIGYCFGAKYVARFMAEGKGIDVGCFAHPSFVDADELKGVTGPLTIAAAETDDIFPKEKRRESEDILEGMKIPWQTSLYSGTSHGFAVRGDVKDPDQKFAKEAAFVQFLGWFDRHLGH